MAVVTVLGAGMMGSALCVPLVDAGHDVRLVGTHLDDEIIESLRRDGAHPKMKLELPRSIRPFFVHQLEEAMRDVEIIGVGVSSAGVHWAAEQLTPHARPERPIVMITKGLELSGERLRVLPDVLADHLPHTGALFPAAIAGPCIAGELARRVETCVAVTGRDDDVLKRLCDALRTNYYFPFASSDVVGVEACAALKNAYAMGIAFATGQHDARGGQPGSVAMHNAESAIFAQSSMEMRTLVALIGGNPSAVGWLPGVGDLDVTTNGGRTGRFGRFLGQGATLQQAIEKMEGATLECLDILRVLEAALPGFERAGRLKPDDLPLLRHMIDVALHGAPVAVPYGRFFTGTGAPR